MPDIKEKTREMRCDGRAGRVLRDERECGGDGDEGGAEDGGETREEEVVLYCLRRKKKKEAIPACVILLSTGDERRITPFNEEIRRRGNVTRCYTPLHRGRDRPILYLFSPSSILHLPLSSLPRSHVFQLMLRLLVPLRWGS